MKEVKAYIRHQSVNRVVGDLEREGFTEMTLIDVKAITASVSPSEYKYSMELAEKYMDVIKLEIVCEDAVADKAVDLIQKAAHTGRKGDGLIFVIPVEKALKI